MRGDTPSVWIWIAGGLIIAALTLLAFFNFFSSFQQSFQTNRALQQLDMLKSTADFVCSSEDGSSRSEVIKISKAISSIYTSNSSLCFMIEQKEYCRPLSCKPTDFTIEIPPPLAQELSYRFTMKKTGSSVHINGVLE